MSCRGSSGLRLTAPSFSSLVLDLLSIASMMRSSSLLTYLLLVLSFEMGALAQTEMAECLAGWEWVCLFSLLFIPTAQGGWKIPPLGMPKSKQEI